MIRILVADDHDLFLESLCCFLEQTDDIEIVTKASNGEEAVEQAGRWQPDLAVLDISMPVMDGIEATRQINSYSPSTRVLILSMLDSVEHVQQAIRAGALGYVLKEMLGNDLVPAIHALWEGHPYFSRKIASIARTTLVEYASAAWFEYAASTR